MEKRSNPPKRPAPILTSDRRSPPMNVSRRTPAIFNSSDFNINNQGASSETIRSIIAHTTRPTLLPPAPNNNEFGTTEQENWEKMRKWAASCVAMYATYAACLCLTVRHLNDGSVSKSEVADYERHELMVRLTQMQDKDCHNLLRMGKTAFATLVGMLKDRRLLRDNSYSSVEEQLAKFLFIIGHNERNRSVQFF